MSMRKNEQGQIESVKTLPDGTEVAHVVESRDEIVAVQHQCQQSLNEATEDLAAYDALVATPQEQPAATPEQPADASTEASTDAAPQDPAVNAPQF